MLFGWTDITLQAFSVILQFFAYPMIQMAIVEAVPVVNTINKNKAAIERANAGKSAQRNPWKNTNVAVSAFDDEDDE